MAVRRKPAGETALEERPVDPTSPPHAKIPVLDAVRGLAILLVVGHHTLLALGAGPGAGILDTASRTMWAGVDLFFVLSGFLITGILLDTKRRAGYFRNFYIRRVLRIFPLYYGALILVLIVLPAGLALIGHARPAFLDTVIPRQAWLWTYMQNWYMARGPHHLHGFGHFWTLAVEEQFYLVWPLVVFAVSQRRLLKVCLSVAVFCLGLRIALYASGTADGWAIRHFTITRADTLLIGAALALMVRNERLGTWIREKAVAVLVGALAVMTAIYLIIGRTTFDDDGLVVTLGYSAIALAGAGLIALNLRKPYIDWAPLRVLGKYSYAIYVVHLPLSSAVRSGVVRVVTGPSFAVLGAVVVFAVTLTLSLAAAMISWWLWESRWLALKDRFARYETEPMPTAP